MNTNPNKKSSPGGRSRSKIVWIITSLLVLGLVGAILGIYLVETSQATETPVATFKVRRSAVAIKVSGTGTISPLNQVVIKSQVEGQNQILELIAQGVEVQADDVLVKLDSSKLEDAIVNQEITARNVEAGLVRAQENLTVTLSQNKSDIAKAELDLEFARENRQKYLEGEYPQQLQQAEADITLAKVELSRANDKLFYSKQLYEKGFITRTELQADQLSVTRNELNLRLAEGDLTVLKDYTHPQQLRQLRSDIEQAGLALDRVKAKANADEVQARADLEAKQAEVQRHQARLKKLRGQLEHCVITAPEPGKVVYATTSRRSRWRPEESLQEGSEVREGQELIHLPKPGGMKATIKIHESSLGKLRDAKKASDKALPVRVTVDSQDDKTYWGVVASIAPLPDSGNWMRPDVKVYDVEVHLTGDTSKLITGNTCRGEIIIERFDEAIYVPVQSVVREGEESVVYVIRGGKQNRQVIQTGLSDSEYVIVTDGLGDGDKVSLSPPLDNAGLGGGNQDQADEIPDTPSKQTSQTQEQPDTETMTFEAFKSMTSEQRRHWMRSAGREKVKQFRNSLTEEQKNELRRMFGRTRSRRPPGQGEPDRGGQNGGDLRPGRTDR